jgi:hypothetical protein
MRLQLSMWKQRIRKLHTIKTFRLIQLVLFLAALWFIFWAHIYEIIVWNKTFLESVQGSIFNVLSYSVSILAIIYLETRIRRTKKIGIITHPSPKTLEELHRENELLKRELQKSKQMPSSKIGIGFLVIGAIVLLTSVVTSSTVLAFIGLGLAFWGGLFLFTRPVKFVISTLLNFTAVSSYITIDRITEDLNYKGKPIYVPQYPKEARIPEYLKGLKEMTVFIPAEDTVAMPNIEEMAKKQFLIKNPKGICITPPGYGIINLFETELKTEFTQIDTDQLYSSLPTIIVNNLELAKEFEINPENDLIHTKTVDSVYNELYSNEQGLKSIHYIGCPLTSAVACALAKTTGKPVTIIKDAVSSDLKTIEVWYKTLET